MVVYLAFNKINGKNYIGITGRPLEIRIARHLTSEHGAFPKALRKYGLTSFSFSIIDTANSTEILQEKEKYWIVFYNSKVPYGYNMTDGGEGRPGSKVSEETKKKMSNALKGHPVSEEAKKRMSIKRVGMKLSEETKKRLSVSHSGKRFSEETRERMSVSQSARRLKGD